ncbi:DNA internalization-related competence protein ComEC/Rec2 [bacterium]|nr:DNA internalization-related competence protein ComEC/Rec2 [bacterium]
MDKKLKVIIFTISYMLGLISFLTDNIGIIAFIFFFFVCTLCLKNFITEKYALIIFIIFTIGIFNCYLRIKNFDFLTTIAPHNDVTVVGKVVSMPSAVSEDYTKFNFKAQKYKFYNKPFENITAKTLVTLTASKKLYKNIEIGDTLSFTGRLTQTKSASNPSEFCYATFLKFKGIHSRLFVNKDNFSIISKANNNDIYGILANLNRIRTKIIDMHSQNIKSPQLELLGGIVFGDDAVTPAEDMKVSFQNSGLTHIIAASGMNVSMIFGMWFFISQILRLNYKFSIFTGIFSIICYTCMTGFGPPVIRASLMLILILIGKLIDKKANSINLLFIVAFLMCLISPSMITNIGFQLSFAVTLGLLLVYQLFFEKIKNKFLNMIISFIVVPLVAQVFAAPIQMFYFNSFSPYSVLANISVVPILGIVSFTGFISCVFALIKPVSYAIIKFFDFILLPFLTFITNIADFFSNLPNSRIIVPSPSVFQIFLYYLAVLCIIFYFSYKEKRKIFLTITLTSLLIMLVTCINFNIKNNEIIFFSVENADAAFITTSKDKHILIDTGKAPYNNFSPAAEKIILKYFEDKGINSLDLLILSHFDSDHAGGAISIMKNSNVKNIVVRSIDDKSPLAIDIIKEAKNKKIPIKVPKINEKLLDDGENKIYAIYSLNGDDNDKSIINIFETPYGKVLFTGDSGIKTFEQIKKYIPNDISVLKSPHHGAKNTISDEYLSHINTKTAILSTGFNIYGHPDKETIDLLKKHNVKILRTDLDNAIKVVFNKNDILLYSYNNFHKKFERIKNDRKVK